MAEAAREGGKLNAFISYADLAFADQARYGSEVRRLWANPPQRLADLDCLSLCGAEVAGFGTGPVALVSALNTDHDWLREHTRSCDWRKNGAQSARPPTVGFCPRVTSHWRRPGRGAGPERPGTNRAAARFHHGERGGGHPSKDHRGGTAEGGRRGSGGSRGGACRGEKAWERQAEQTWRNHV